MGVSFSCSGLGQQGELSCRAAPKRRARVYEAYNAPFPLPGSEQEECEEPVYRANLVNQHVVVRDQNHAEQIYSKGYFGKGFLSRSRPDYNVSNQWEDVDGCLLPVVSQSRYDQLLSWAKGALLAQGLDEEAVSQTLIRLSEPVEFEGGRTTLPAQTDRQADRQTGLERPGQVHTRPHVPVLSRSDLQEPGREPDHLLLVCTQHIGSERREVKKNPFRVTDCLHLSLEEAFFLVYALGCLSLYQDQEPLSIIQLWRTFRAIQPGFETSYAAYHHYRSRAWVPKPGLKYGADLLLYYKGPPFFHASYSVVVERVGPGSPLRPFTWRSLAALSRITSSVSKELLLCYIIYPSDLSELDLNSPVCLSRLAVQEVLLSRWISSRERSEQEDV